MAQGHTIPLLYLSRLLLRRSAAVTVITTAANSPLIRSHLRDTDASILEIPFPQNIPGIPPGVENTHKLPSMSFFFTFLKSTKLLQKSFEHALESLQPPGNCIISDGFLGWTLQSAKKFNIPRFVFWGMSNFAAVMYGVLGKEKPHLGVNCEEEEFPMPGFADFPDLRFTVNDFDPPWNEVEPAGEVVDLLTEHLGAAAMSDGIVVNSFYELEPLFVDFWNRNFGPTAWCVGPLCAAAELETLEKRDYIQFLDEKLEKGESVIYVSFGTQAEVSAEQLEAIATGLENSGVSFLWALKSGAVQSSSR